MGSFRCTPPPSDGSRCTMMSNKFLLKPSGSYLACQMDLKHLRLEFGKIDVQIQELSSGSLASKKKNTCAVFIVLKNTIGKHLSVRQPQTTFISRSSLGFTDTTARSRRHKAPLASAWPWGEADRVFNINTNQSSRNRSNPFAQRSDVDNILVWDLDERVKTRRGSGGNDKQMFFKDPRLIGASSISSPAMHSHSSISSQIPERNTRASCYCCFSKACLHCNWLMLTKEKKSKLYKKPHTNISTVNCCFIREMGTQTAGSAHNNCLLTKKNSNYTKLGWSEVWFKKQKVTRETQTTGRPKQETTTRQQTDKITEEHTDLNTQGGLVNKGQVEDIRAIRAGGGRIRTGSVQIHKIDEEATCNIKQEAQQQDKGRS